MAIKKEKELTNKEKAQFILENGYSSRSQTTLERLSKDELDFIIKNQREPQAKEINTENKEATASLIQNVLDFLDTYKKDKQGKGISAPVKNFIIKNSESLDFANAKVSGAVAVGLVAICFIGILVDSLVGWDTIKKRIQERAEAKRAQDDQQKQ